MILYHFTTSPFARRVRLVLALKGLSAELRDARASIEHRADVQRLNPLHTVPVLVDDELVLCDSAAICQYLDRKVPGPPLFPAGIPGAMAFELIALADGALNLLIDLGMRYAPIHHDPQFPVVQKELMGRAERALERLAQTVSEHGAGPLCGGVWSGADIALYTAVTWLEGLPERAATTPAARSIVELGWTLPPELSAWANQHRSRADVRSLG